MCTPQMQQAMRGAAQGATIAAADPAAATGGSVNAGGAAPTGQQPSAGAGAPSGVSVTGDQGGTLLGGGSPVGTPGSIGVKGQAGQGIDPRLLRPFTRSAEQPSLAQQSQESLQQAQAADTARVQNSPVVTTPTLPNFGFRGGRGGAGQRMPLAGGFRGRGGAFSQQPEVTQDTQRLFELTGGVDPSNTRRVGVGRGQRDPLTSYLYSDEAFRRASSGDPLDALDRAAAERRAKGSLHGVDPFGEGRRAPMVTVGKKRGLFGSKKIKQRIEDPRKRAERAQNPTVAEARRQQEAIAGLTGDQDTLLAAGVLDDRNRRRQPTLLSG